MYYYCTAIRYVPPVASVTAYSRGMLSCQSRASGRSLCAWGAFYSIPPDEQNDKQDWPRSISHNQKDLLPVQANIRRDSSVSRNSLSYGQNT